jgi:hypothetical protein
VAAGEGCRVVPAALACPWILDWRPACTLARRFFKQWQSGVNARQRPELMAWTCSLTGPRGGEG